MRTLRLKKDKAFLRFHRIPAEEVCPKSPCPSLLHQAASQQNQNRTLGTEMQHRQGREGHPESDPWKHGVLWNRERKVLHKGRVGNKLWVWYRTRKERKGAHGGQATLNKLRIRMSCTQLRRGLSFECGLHNPGVGNTAVSGTAGRTRGCWMLSPGKSLRSGGSDHSSGSEVRVDNC